MCTKWYQVDVVSQKVKEYENQPKPITYHNDTVLFTTEVGDVIDVR